MRLSLGQFYRKISKRGAESPQNSNLPGQGKEEEAAAPRLGTWGSVYSRPGELAWPSPQQQRVPWLQPGPEWPPSTGLQQLSPGHSLWPLRHFKHVTSKAPARHLPIHLAAGKVSIFPLAKWREEYGPAPRERTAWPFVPAPSGDTQRSGGQSPWPRCGFEGPRVFITFVVVSLCWALGDTLEVSSTYVRMIQCIPECSSEVTTTIKQG